MKTRLLAFFTLFASVVFLSSCSGLPTKTTVHTKNALGFQLKSISLSLNRSAELEKIITPEITERVESLFKKKLVENNIMISADSQISLKILFKKYEDGNVAARGISGAILGINVGEPAKIEAEVVIVLRSHKEIARADVLVESSRSGWNFSYGYGGAKSIEDGFVEEVIKLLQN
ncbi:MAG: hypothetical protein AAB832_00280 [Patescibacteria group bacterium]